jgi:ribosomal protein S5
MKAEKYNIVTEAGGETSMKVRFGFGAAGEEVQKLLEVAGLDRIRVKIEGTTTEVSFIPGRPFRLVDIKQRIKSLSFDF